MIGRGLPVADPRQRVVSLVAVSIVVVSLGAGCGGGTPTSAPDAAEPLSSVTTSSPRATTSSVVRPASVIHDFVVPAGTGKRQELGEELDFIPQPLEVRVGDSIRVRNDDGQLVRLGLFDVQAGETVSMAFNSPGEMEGIIFSDQSSGCGVPPPDVQTFTVVVNP